MRWLWVLVVVAWLKVEPLVFRSAVMMREEPAVAVNKSRFLADKPGFGMTSLEGCVDTAPPPFWQDRVGNS
jgi:hypothetical protein